MRSSLRHGGKIALKGSGRLLSALVLRSAPKQRVSKGGAAPDRVADR